jgi:hypothetical protein
MTKAIIFDSGTLINLSMNGLLYILEELKNKTNVKFIITNQVKYETIDRPLKVPRFELGALRIYRLLENKIIELPITLDIDENEINKKTKIFLDKANSLLISKGREIKIVSQAEMSCLALSEILTNLEIPNMIAIDERTTRILAEKPENLEKLMSHRLHTKVKLKTKNFKPFKNFRFLRSTELVFVAHKLNLLKIKHPKTLEAALYATKFKGASVSWDELKVLKKL